MVARDKSPLGTHYLTCEVEIEAGEETASTDGRIEFESYEYAASESSVTVSEDWLDVEVSVMSDEGSLYDYIEAILPKTSSHQKVSEYVGEQPQSETVSSTVQVGEKKERKIKKKKKKAKSLSEEEALALKARLQAG
ncbi:hypothetical protein AAVH_10043 [Aphelenchoides avenae]|nr:hypothetical protein AAVH_10043 [Aphelenchus avenae]